MVTGLNPPNFGRITRLIIIIPAPQAPSSPSRWSLSFAIPVFFVSLEEDDFIDLIHVSRLEEVAYSTTVFDIPYLIIIQGVRIITE
jgi:hypothetical protein